MEAAMSIFPEELPQFESLDAFFAADERRARSPEADYGVFWWDGPQGYSSTWKLSAIENTGEIYVMRSHAFRRGAEAMMVVLLGQIADQDPEYAKADQVLEGWNLQCGKGSSLQWAIDRVRAAVEGAEPLSILCRHQTLGVHVHIDLFVGRVTGSRGKAGELTMREDEWPEFLAGLEAGFGSRLELAEREPVV